MPSEILDVDNLRKKIIGLGEKSIRKSYYPELQKHVQELEALNRQLLSEIEEHKQSDEAVYDVEKKFRALFEAMTEMVALHDLIVDEAGRPVDYRIIDCNAAYTKITGIRAEDAIGHSASELYGLNPPPYLKIYSDVAISGIPHHFTEFYPPMEKYFAVSVVSPGKGKFATITTDITDIQRVKEKITQKNKELENYLYIASHDLRAPLVNIQGFCTRLKKQAEDIRQTVSSVPAAPGADEKLRGILSEGIPKTLDFIFTNVATMDQLINALLVISRTGRIVMTVKKIDMNMLLRGILDGLGFQIEQERAVVSLEKLADCYGDENLLNQLFSNIIVNALKYRDPVRTPEIQIGSESFPFHIRYYVKDNGIGIPEQHRQRIWDVFYRVNRETPVSGDGIGLSIVKRIVDKHRGKIWLESEEGRGSTFFVELPASPFEAEE